ncbi:unnamed protein product [Acanthoscelides obtectus]|uniref:Uncharacterized protein n=1 Tax=Acanthoscelides obtectus TaxID=200917 RepID=A0A9P0M2L1_ACAOB|nr:unnamed protein product [Acanthoscelides obtectus]CAK1627659.1 hypothetical protein AOBTE_LOCUS4740 [Acanthoscelides obtectus]
MYAGGSGLKRMEQVKLMVLPLSTCRSGPPSICAVGTAIKHTSKKPYASKSKLEKAERKLAAGTISWGRTDHSAKVIQNQGHTLLLWFLPQRKQPGERPDDVNGCSCGSAMFELLPPLLRVPPWLRCAAGTAVPL